MRIHFIIHESFEAPGAYEVWAKKNNHSITYSRVYLYEPLPIAVDNIDMLVIMGGPQNPSSTKSEYPYFDTTAEQKFIRTAINANKLVIGICLGSQLIGQSLGAFFEHSPEKEIGKFSITLTKEGKSDPLLSHLGKSCSVGHWHSDMPGLTSTAKILAFSEGCPRQIVKYTDNVYGFQCHMELTKEIVALLIANSQAELSQASKYRFIETPEELLSHDYSEMNQMLYTFLDKVYSKHKDAE